MWTNVERAAPVPMRGTVVALCFLAALGLAAIARSIPDSYAGMPDGEARTGYRAAPVAIADAVAPPGPASPPGDVRKRPRCPECGTIESMRTLERSGYEITVRLRDGTTTVFNEATPRAWRPGSRVMVIGGLQVASR